MDMTHLGYGQRHILVLVRARGASRRQVASYRGTGELGGEVTGCKLGVSGSSRNSSSFPAFATVHTVKARVEEESFDGRDPLLQPSTKPHRFPSEKKRKKQHHGHKTVMFRLGTTAGFGDVLASSISVNSCALSHP